MRFLLILFFAIILEASNLYEKIRIQWVDFLTGNQSMRILSPQEKEIFLQSLNTKSQKILSLIQTQKDKKFLFSEYPNMKNGSDILATYTHLFTLAQAYITPDSAMYQNQKIKDIILSSLQWLYQNAYKEGFPEYGNWWHWEIGIPKKLNEILAVMYSQIPLNEIKQYLKASFYFQPYAKYSGSSPTARYSSSPNFRISTGGNRLDTSIISFARGILLGDEAQILDGINAVPDVGEYVKTNDGFYIDGSFIQHTTVPYNGTYASVLLNGLGAILYLTKDTPYEIKDHRLENIYQSIINGYSFLFINGGITDAVSGRSISRDHSNELTRGKELIKPIAIISEYVNEPYKTQMRSMLKTILHSISQEDLIKKINNFKARAILEEIKKNQPLEHNQTKSKVFWGMDRVVHQGKKGAKFVLSMHSSRIANYESMNGENKKGWHTGDGMVYIYDQDSSKVKDFWATVDPYHLSGTTESIKKRKDFSGMRMHFNRLVPRQFAGGVSNSTITFAGMDFLSWNNLTTAKKSWFFFDDTMIAMGSNISSLDGEVHTTINNRDSRNDPFIYQSQNKFFSTIQEFQGSWKERGGKDDTLITKPYKLIYINHGTNPKNAKYLYSVGLDSINLSDIQILSQNQNAHAIKVKDVLGIHFWQDIPYKVDKYRSLSTLSILAKEQDKNLELWVSDPTQSSLVPSILQIDGNYTLIDSTDLKLKIQTKSNKTTLKINNQSSGETFYIKLKKIE